MSVLSMIDKNKMSPGLGAGFDAPGATFDDVVSAAAESTARNYSVVSKPLFEDIEAKNRANRYQELTGRSLYDDAIDNHPEREKIKYYNPASGAPPDKKLETEVIDTFIVNLRTQDPERFKDIMTSGQISETVKAKAQNAYQRHQKANAGATGMAAFSGSLAGGVVASFADPLNLATIPLGAGLGAGLIKTMLIEGAVNAGTEVLAHPIVSQWQKELGQEYGLRELAENAGTSFVFGAGISGLMKGLPMAYAKSKSLMYGEMKRIATEEMNYELERASAYQERVAHVDESNPAKVSENVAPEVHAEMMTQLDAAINQGQPLSAGPITDADILAMDRSKMEPGAAGAHERITEDYRYAPGSEPDIVQRFDAEGNRIYHSDDLALMQTQIEGGAFTKGGARGESGGSYGSSSSYLEYFQRKGLKKDEVLGIIERTRAGEKVTERQAKILSDLHDSMIRQTRDQANELLSFRKAEPPTLERQKQMTELHDSPEWVQAERADFDEKMVVGDQRIWMDDESGAADMSVDEMRQFFKAEDDFLSSISTCGLGGAG